MHGMRGSRRGASGVGSIRAAARVAAPAPAPAAARPCVCCSQVRLFYENMYKHRSVWDESEILKPLPAVLQKELVRDM